MKKIAIVNHKGGVAKTTTASNVASLLSKRFKVLAVDLDPQCNLTKSFTTKRSDEGVFDLFLGRKCNPVIRVNDNLDLIPASFHLSGLDAMLGSKLEKERILADALDELYQDKYDVVIMDCPPSLQLPTVNALVAATDMIVPLTPEYHPVSGLMDIEEIYKIVSRRLNPGLRFTGLIVTRFNVSKGMHMTVDAKVRESYGELVFNTRIRENIKLAECPMLCQDIFTYAPESHGAEDYARLTDEIIERIGLL